MSALSAYLENKINDHILGGPDYARPANVSFGLFTALPTESGGGTEVTGGSYARATVVNSGASFAASASGTKVTNTLVAFPTATADWGSIVGFGIFDASSGGNLLYFGALLTARTVNNGDTARFASGDFSITFD